MHGPCAERMQTVPDATLLLFRLKYSQYDSKREPAEFCGQNKEGKEHSVTLTEKSGHLAWCALVALALARQNGDALSPAQENLFLTRWLAAALKQRRFSRDVAPDIEWLLKQGRQLGVSAKLASKLN